MQDKEYSFSGTLSDIKKEIEQLEKIQSYESRIEYMQKELSDIESFVSNWANEIGVDTFNCITPLDYIEAIRKSLMNNQVELKKPKIPAKDLHYSEWPKGSILRVLKVFDGDPFEVGDYVKHNDSDGDSVPYCYYLLTGVGCAMYAEDQLEFIAYSLEEFEELKKNYSL